MDTLILLSICCSYYDYDYEHTLDIFFYFSLFYFKPIAYIRSGNFPNPQLGRPWESNGLYPLTCSAICEC